MGLKESQGQEESADTNPASSGPVASCVTLDRHPTARGPVGNCEIRGCALCSLQVPAPGRADSCQTLDPSVSEQDTHQRWLGLPVYWAGIETKAQNGPLPLPRMN